VFYTGIECVRRFTINIYGETCIEAGVPYMITCNVKQFKVNRITNFKSADVLYIKCVAKPSTSQDHTPG
jgi:hypothetical protein